MRHRVRGSKLNRNTAHRRALKRNLARSLFLTYGVKDHIVTTLEKAKWVQSFCEKLITLSKDKTLHNYRRGLQLLGDEAVVNKLFDEIGPAYRERPGGYTRIVRIEKRRLGDRATQVLFGFVRDVEDEPAAAVVADDAEA